MRTLLAVLLLTGCGPKVAVLEARVDALEAENAELRARLDAVEAQVAVTQGKVEQWDRMMEMASSALGGLGGDGELPLSTPPTDPGPHCEAIGEGRFRFDGPVDADRLARSVRTVPHKGADGQVDGYRLSAIRRGLLADSCGFKNGDVVHMVNGQPITTMDAAMAAWQAVQEAGELRVDVTRRGQPVSWVIERTP